MRFLILPIGTIIRMVRGNANSGTNGANPTMPSAGSSSPGAGSPNLHFFGCCDFRKAVLIIDSITVVLSALLALVMLVVLNDPDLADEYEGDVANELDDTVGKGVAQSGVLETIMEFIFIANIAIAVLGIYGALNFKRWALVTTGIFYLIFLVLDIFAMNIFMALYWAMAFYPHLSMIKLMDSGIMTETNYPNIASCCGNSPQNGPVEVSTVVPRGDFA